MPCCRNMLTMMPISWPLSILLWPAQKIMCQKRATFSCNWLGLLIIRYNQIWVLTSMAPGS